MGGTTRPWRNPHQLGPQDRLFLSKYFSLGHQVSRVTRRFWSAGLAASLRGRTARSPAIPRGSCEPCCAHQVPGRAQRGRAPGVSASPRSRSPQPGEVAGLPLPRAALRLPSRPSGCSRWSLQNFPAECAGTSVSGGSKPTAGTALAPLPACRRRNPGRVLPRPASPGAAGWSRSQRRGRARARAPRQAGSQRAPAGCGTHKALSW